MDTARKPQTTKRMGKVDDQVKKLQRTTLRSCTTKNLHSNAARHNCGNPQSLSNNKVNTTFPISRVKPSSPSIRIRPMKTGENHETVQQHQKKSIVNHKSSTLRATISHNKTSRQLLVTNDTFKSLNALKLCGSQENDSKIVSLTSKLPLQSAHLRPRKTRKVIDDTTFLPISQPNRICKNSSRSVGEESTVSRAHYHSNELSDWEIIDWPWVTPYEPLEGIVLLCDIKKINSLPLINSVGKTSVCQWSPMTSLSNLALHEQSRGQFSSLGNYDTTYHPKEADCYKTLNTKKIWGDNSECGASLSPTYRKISSPRRRLTKSEPSPQHFMCDAGVISASPVYPIQNKNINCRFGQETKLCVNPESGESHNISLLENINEFTKNITQMRKEDRYLIEELLEVLRKVESDDHPPTERQDLDENSKIDFKNTRAHLNPNVPDFQPKFHHTFEDCAEQIRLALQQKTNLRQVSPQKSRPRNQYKENIENITSESGIQVLSERVKSKPPWHYPTRTNEELISPEISSKKIDNFEDTLLETSLSKIRSLEFEIQKQLSLPLGMHHNVNFRYFPAYTDTVVNSSSRNTEIDDDGPGRVANAMEHSWAIQMLEKFKGKYPMTGAIKSDPVINIKKKLISDIQQRLEYLLLVKKEKEITNQYYQEEQVRP